MEKEKKKKKKKKRKGSKLLAVKPEAGKREKDRNQSYTQHTTVQNLFTYTSPFPSVSSFPNKG